MSTFGKYQLLAPIAEGGMAEIFLASVSGVEDFSKLVVLKRILPHLAKETEFVRMFVDEAKLAVQLTHPNIVQIFELGAIDGRYFIAMEYVPGTDLAQLRQGLSSAGERFPPGAALAIAREILHGLSYAHDKVGERGDKLGVVHRDISPHNILLSNEGMVKLTDFGIAQAATKTTKTSTGQVRGKPSYLAPEQAAGERCDYRADLFAFALVLYEILSGTRPYAADNDYKALELARKAHILPLASAMRDCPAPVSAVMERALAFAPSDRFASAEAFEHALIAASAGWATPFSASALGGLVRRFPRREDALVATMGTADAPRGATLVRQVEKRWPWFGVALAVVPVSMVALWARRPAPAPAPVVAAIAPASVPASAPVAAPPAPHVMTGSLALNSLPWSEVFVDGEKLTHHTPIENLVLAAGTHHVRLFCPRKQNEQSFDVHIEPGKQLRKIVHF